MNANVDHCPRHARSPLRSGINPRYSVSSPTHEAAPVTQATFHRPHRDRVGYPLMPKWLCPADVLFVVFRRHVRGISTIGSWKRTAVPGRRVQAWVFYQTALNDEIPAYHCRAMWVSANDVTSSVSQVHAAKGWGRQDSLVRIESECITEADGFEISQFVPMR